MAKEAAQHLGLSLHAANALIIPPAFARKASESASANFTPNPKVIAEISESVPAVLDEVPRTQALQAASFRVPPSET